jgi:hypothetical protein
MVLFRDKISRDRYKDKDKKVEEEKRRGHGVEEIIYILLFVAQK